MSAPLDIKSTLRGPLPRLPFGDMARTVLGARYELSLVICSDTLARSVNKKHRNKTYAANVLSFPLTKNEGEIFLNVRASAREAHKYGVSQRARLALLFVHGLYHLKGLRHGRTMESEERKILRHFNIT